MKVLRMIPALLFVAVSACTSGVEDSSPGKTLESYVQISFSAKSIEDKARMETLLTGDTKSRLSSWSAEQFTKSFVEANRKFKTLKILETRKLNDHEVILTYELSFQEGPKDKMIEITQKKLCTLVKEADSWKIKEVRSVRESIEYLNELSFP
jgi:hypothetical protein